MIVTAVEHGVVITQVIIAVIPDHSVVQTRHQTPVRTLTARTRQISVVRTTVVRQIPAEIKRGTSVILALVVLFFDLIFHGRVYLPGARLVVNSIL